MGTQNLFLKIIWPRKRSPWRSRSDLDVDLCMFVQSTGYSNYCGQIKIKYVLRLNKMDLLNIMPLEGSTRVTRSRSQGCLWWTNRETKGSKTTYLWSTDLREGPQHTQANRPQMYILVTEIKLQGPVTVSPVSDSSAVCFHHLISLSLYSIVLLTVGVPRMTWQPAPSMFSDSLRSLPTFRSAQTELLSSSLCLSACPPSWYSAL